MELVETKKTIDKYPVYKDSGIKWLGDIPEKWELTRLGTRFNERRTKVSDKDFPPLSVTKNGTVPQLANAAKTNDGDNRKLVKLGDFVINSRSDRKGSSGIAFQDGSVSLINIVIQPIDINPTFCNYLLKSYNFIEEFYRMGHGIVADLWTTRYDEMKTIMVGIPSEIEQTAIANFLDEKTAKIDKAIAQKEKLIALLKERKQIIIQNAVTKGIDPNVKLKDSGVEWIGEIPEHWEVNSVKYCLSIPITDGPHTTPELLDEGMPFISAEAIKNGKIDFQKKRGYISIKDHNLFCLKYKPKRDDIYMVKSGATTGNIAIVETDEEFSIWSPLAVFRANISKVIPNYLYCFLESSSFRKGVELKWSFGTQQNIGMGVLSNLPIVYPSVEEQKLIVKTVKKENTKFNKSISLQQKQIEKLKEYKATLIDSAVTGKIKVC
jgi:type I restriction enzyme, S subunit